MEQSEKSPNSAMSITGVELTRQLVEEYAADLPEPSRVEWAEGKEMYRSADSIEQAAFFVKGYAASCVEVSYGHESLEDFARQVQQSYNSVKEQRRVYRRVAGLKNDDRSSVLAAVRAGALSYTHLLCADPLKDDGEYVEVLMRAHDNSWSKRKLAEVVALKRQLKVAEGESPAEIKEGEGFLAEEAEGPEPEAENGPAADPSLPTLDSPELPPFELSEVRKAYYRVSRYFLELTRLDPEEVAAECASAEDAANDAQEARKVAGWFGRYEEALKRRGEETAPGNLRRIK